MGVLPRGAEITVVSALFLIYTCFVVSVPVVQKEEHVEEKYSAAPNNTPISKVYIFGRPVYIREPFVVPQRNSSEQIDFSKLFSDAKLRRHRASYPDQFQGQGQSQVQYQGQGQAQGQVQPQFQQQSQGQGQFQGPAQFQSQNQPQSVGQGQILSQGQGQSAGISQGQGGEGTVISSGQGQGVIQSQLLQQGPAQFQNGPSIQPGQILSQGGQRGRGDLIPNAVQGLGQERFQGPGQNQYPGRGGQYLNANGEYVTNKYPLRQCYTERSGYMCCNLHLEKVIHDTTVKMKDSKSCNLQKMSTMLANITESVFGTDFEAISAIGDFASKIHFYHDYVCKMQRDGRTILVYATPDRHRDEKPPKKEYPTYPEYNNGGNNYPTNNYPYTEYTL